MCPHYINQILTSQINFYTYIRTFNKIIFILFSKLDPPDSHILFLKAASLSFLNDEVWTTSRAKQGRYLRIFYYKLH